MSMLASFFDIQKDSKELFQGLEIIKEEKICKEFMNQYPTLFLSFKDVDGTTFENAFGLLQLMISEICKKNAYLLESEFIDEDDKKIFRRLKSREACLSEIQGSIVLIMNMMYQSPRQAAMDIIKKC